MNLEIIDVARKTRNLIKNWKKFNEFYKFDAKMARNVIIFTLFMIMFISWMTVKANAPTQTIGPEIWVYLRLMLPTMAQVRRAYVPFFYFSFFHVIFCFYLTNRTNLLDSDGFACRPTRFSSYGLIRSFHRLVL